MVPSETWYPSFSVLPVFDSQAGKMHMLKLQVVEIDLAGVKSKEM